MGIHDILVRIRIPRSVPLTNGSLSGSNSGSGSFFIDFKDAKKYLFSFFFLIACPAYQLQSKKLNFLLKLCFKILFCRHYFSPLNTFIRKRKGSGSGSGSASLTNGFGSGRPKNMRIRIPNTVTLYFRLKLFTTVFFQ